MMLSGKKAIVTGASRGIGAAIAEAFAREGADLLITARSEAIVDKARVLAETSGRDVVGIAGDIASSEHLKTLALAAKQRWGKVDILVNNAGLLNPARLGMVGMPELDAMFAVNVRAMIGFTQYMVRLMKHGGCIINMASIAGTAGLEQMTAYSATKGAVVAFTKAAAKELGFLGIRVNAIAPGLIATDMTDALGAQVIGQNIAKVRLGRIGAPGDVANCALFLGSDMASYITGQIIGVDGGYVI